MILIVDHDPEILEKAQKILNRDRQVFPASISSGHTAILYHDCRRCRQFQLASERRRNSWPSPFEFQGFQDISIAHRMVNGPRCYLGRTFARILPGSWFKARINLPRRLPISCHAVPG
jgi:hypothetical protein